MAHLISHSMALKQSKATHLLQSKKRRSFLGLQLHGTMLLCMIGTTGVQSNKNIINLGYQPVTNFHCNQCVNSQHHRELNSMPMTECDQEGYIRTTYRTWTPMANKSKHILWLLDPRWFDSALKHLNWTEKIFHNIIAKESSLIILPLVLSIITFFTQSSWPCSWSYMKVAG